LGTAGASLAVFGQKKKDAKQQVLLNFFLLFGFFIP
jgi:hypothetical protein